MSKPSWNELQRHRKGGQKANKHEAAAALHRFAQTPDGQIVQKWIFESMIYRSTPVGADDGALRDLAAEQRVAMKFLNFMEGEPDGDGDGSSGGKDG